MAGAAGDGTEGVGGDWPFAGADTFAEYSSVFAELGWPGGLAAGAGELPVLDLPEAAAPPPVEVTRPEEVVAPARSGDAAASSSSSGDGDGDGTAPGSHDRKPAAETA
ncbi:putative WRKY transcription factor 57 [Panicum miliaceum]|uniref:WRKY transcription factor 57 n=1 Tax=Panicum miliaceum TaxID=4540 RepID=A0A3L6TEZ2_PANMI|nr:putative WRKY transcription factor 57 [Panicum miliaceum]